MVISEWMWSGTNLLHIDIGEIIISQQLKQE